MQEEIFGPVFVLRKFGKSSSNVRSHSFDESSLISDINSSSFGLSASLYSNDKKMIMNLAKKVESGTVFLNKPAFSDSDFPFGGVKKSGFGRECGEHSLGAFAQLKATNLQGMI